MLLFRFRVTAGISLRLSSQNEVAGAREREAELVVLPVLQSATLRAAAHASGGGSPDVLLSVEWRRRDVHASFDGANFYDANESGRGEDGRRYRYYGARNGLRVVASEGYYAADDAPECSALGGLDWRAPNMAELIGLTSDDSFAEIKGLESPGTTAPGALVGARFAAPFPSSGVSVIVGGSATRGIRFADYAAVAAAYSLVVDYVAAGDAQLATINLTPHSLDLAGARREFRAGVLEVFRGESLASNEAATMRLAVNLATRVNENEDEVTTAGRLHNLYRAAGEPSKYVYAPVAGHGGYSSLRGADGARLVLDEGILKPAPSDYYGRMICVRPVDDDYVAPHSLAGARVVDAAGVLATTLRVSADSLQGGAALVGYAEAYRGTGEVALGETISLSWRLPLGDANAGGLSLAARGGDGLPGRVSLLLMAASPTLIAATRLVGEVAPGLGLARRFVVDVGGFRNAGLTFGGQRINAVGAVATLVGGQTLSYVGRRRGLHLLLGSEVLTGAEGLKESACAAGGVGGRWGGEWRLMTLPEAAGMASDAERPRLGAVVGVTVAGAETGSALNGVAVSDDDFAALDGPPLALSLYVGVASDDSNNGESVSVVAGVFEPGNGSVRKTTGARLACVLPVSDYVAPLGPAAARFDYEGESGSSALRLLDSFYGGGVDSFSITARAWRFGARGVEYLSDGFSVRADTRLLGTGDAASVTVLYSAEGAAVRVALGRRGANTQWLISVFALRSDLTLGYFALTAWQPESILWQKLVVAAGPGTILPSIDNVARVSDGMVRDFEFEYLGVRRGLRYVATRARYGPGWQENVCAAAGEGFGGRFWRLPSLAEALALGGDGGALPAFAGYSAPGGPATETAAVLAARGTGVNEASPVSFAGEMFTDFYVLKDGGYFSLLAPAVSPQGSESFSPAGSESTGRVVCVVERDGAYERPPDPVRVGWFAGGAELPEAYARRTSSAATHMEARAIRLGEAGEVFDIEKIRLDAIRIPAEYDVSVAGVGALNEGGSWDVDSDPEGGGYLRVEVARTSAHSGGRVLELFATPEIGEGARLRVTLLPGGLAQASLTAAGFAVREIGDVVVVGDVSDSRGVGAARRVRMELGGRRRGLYFMRSTESHPDGYQEGTCAALGAEWRLPKLREVLGLSHDGRAEIAARARALGLGENEMRAVGADLPDTPGFPAGEDERFEVELRADDDLSAGRLADGEAVFADVYAQDFSAADNRAVRLTLSPPEFGESGVGSPARIVCVQESDGDYAAPFNLAGVGAEVLGEIGVGFLSPRVLATVRARVSRMTRTGTVPAPEEMESVETEWGVGDDYKTDLDAFVETVSGEGGESGEMTVAVALGDSRALVHLVNRNAVDLPSGKLTAALRLRPRLGAVGEARLDPVFAPLTEYDGTNLYLRSAGSGFLGRYRGLYYRNGDCSGVSGWRLLSLTEAASYRFSDSEFAVAGADLPGLPAGTTLRFRPGAETDAAIAGAIGHAVPADFYDSGGATVAALQPDDARALGALAVSDARLTLCAREAPGYAAPADPVLALFNGEARNALTISLFAQGAHAAGAVAGTIGVSLARYDARGSLFVDEDEALSLSFSGEALGARLETEGSYGSAVLTLREPSRDGGVATLIAVSPLGVRFELAIALELSTEAETPPAFGAGTFAGAGFALTVSGRRWFGGDDAELGFTYHGRRRGLHYAYSDSVSPGHGLLADATDNVCAANGWRAPRLGEALALLSDDALTTGLDFPADFPGGTREAWTIPAREHPQAVALASGRVYFGEAHDSVAALTAPGGTVYAAAGVDAAGKVGGLADGRIVCVANARGDYEEQARVGMMRWEVDGAFSLSAERRQDWGGRLEFLIRDGRGRLTTVARDSFPHWVEALPASANLSLVFDDDGGVRLERVGNADGGLLPLPESEFALTLRVGNGVVFSEATVAVSPVGVLPFAGLDFGKARTLAMTLRAGGASHTLTLTYAGERAGRMWIRTAGAVDDVVAHALCDSDDGWRLATMREAAALVGGSGEVAGHSGFVGVEGGFWSGAFASQEGDFAALTDAVFADFYGELTSSSGLHRTGAVFPPDGSLRVSVGYGPAVAVCGLKEGDDDSELFAPWGLRVAGATVRLLSGETFAATLNGSDVNVLLPHPLTEGTLYAGAELVRRERDGGLSRDYESSAIRALQPNRFGASGRGTLEVSLGNAGTLPEGVVSARFLATPGPLSSLGSALTLRLVLNLHAAAVVAGDSVLEGGSAVVTVRSIRPPVDFQRVTMVYRGDYRNLRLMLSEAEVDDGLVEPVCESLGGEWRVPTLREALGARLGRDAAAGVSVLGGLAVGVVPGLGGAGMVAGRTPPFEFGDAGAAPLAGVANVFSGALAAESLGGVWRMPALAGAESLSPPPYVGRVLCVEEIGEGHFETPNPAEVQFNSEGDSREERFYVEVVRPTRRGSERVSLSADFRATVVDSDAALDVWTFSDDDGCAKEGETRSLADTAEGDYHCVAERNVEFADWCVRKRDAEIVFAGSALRCENRRSDSPIVSETQQHVICRPFGRHYQWYLLNGKTAQFWCTPNGGTTCKADEYYDADLHKCLERGRDWVGLASAGSGASGELGYTVRVFSPYGPSQDYVGTIFAAERSSVSVPDVGGVAGSGIELGDDVLLAGISSAHGGAAVDARFRYRGVWRGLHWIRSVDVLDEGVLESSCAAAGAGWRVPTLAETMMLFDNGDSFRAFGGFAELGDGGLLPGLHDFAVEYPAKTAADDWSSAPESGESFAALAGAYSTVRVGTRSRAVAAVNSSASSAEFEGVVYCAQEATGRYVAPADYAGLEFGVGEARAVSDDSSAFVSFQTVTILAVRQTREGSAYGGVADVSLVGDSDLRVDVRREGSGAYVAALLADAAAVEFGETTATLAATVAGGAGLEYVATLRLGQAVFAGEALAHGFVTVAEVGAVNANDGSQTTITMTYAGRRRGFGYDAFGCCG